MCVLDGRAHVCIVGGSRRQQVQQQQEQPVRAHVLLLVVRHTQSREAPKCPQNRHALNPRHQPSNPPYLTDSDEHNDAVHAP